MAGSMAALYAATGIIAHHDGVKHAPQSNINSMAMVHADERAYSPHRGTAYGQQRAAYQFSRYVSDDIQVCDQPEREEYGLKQ